MRSICLYFQIHQPFRLRNYRFFDIGNDHHYYDDFSNRSIMKKVANKCYLPANKILLDLIKDFGCRFKVAFSISGVAMEQFQLYAPEVLDSFKELVKTGCVEILSETYSHSLVSLNGKEDFVEQVNAHKAKVKEHFGVVPTTFRNTELIYSDYIGSLISEMGYKAVLTEGAKHILGWKSPNFVYCNAVNPKLKVLLKNYRLSDDIAFRFSNQSWSEWPLTAEKYVKWLDQIDAKDEVVNLFMDYETFGEHQWAETGIFDFLKSFPKEVLSKTDFTFVTPGEAASKHQPVSMLHVNHPISWADEERDLTAWLGNELQDEAFHTLYGLSKLVKETNDADIHRDWHYLQTSDHFYYMCTKWFSDGEVHKYFNPYPSPYEAFINYMNVLADFKERVVGAIAFNKMEKDQLDIIENLQEIGINQIRKLPKDQLKKLLDFSDKVVSSLKTKKSALSASASAVVAKEDGELKKRVTRAKKSKEEVLLFEGEQLELATSTLETGIEPTAKAPRKRKAKEV